MQALTASQDLLRQAAGLIASGDAAGAVTLLGNHLAENGSLGRQGDFLMAQAGSRIGDVARERDALHRILTGNARDLPALLAMGESFARAGDDRAALSWFTAALKQAAVSPPPQQLHPLLDRASRYCSEAQQRLSEHFDEALEEIGASSMSANLRYALDMLRGRSPLYLQQPSMFYYPGLPQRFFYERDEFDWVAPFEAEAEAMRDEFHRLTTGGDEAFAPYVRRLDNRPASSSPLLEDPSWGAAYLWLKGEPDERAQRDAPRTMAALATAPQPVIPGRSPMALYSRLRPGTHIAPHHGMLNTRLICHLPLVAPDGCALRVGADTRAWRFGEMLIFDDSVEHEAWNRGTQDRTVLLFEIWRPEIAGDERAILSRLFDTIDRVDPQRGQDQE